jgi:phytoene dehydrogenase-like protein
VDIPIWARFQSNTDPSLTPRGACLSTWGIMLPWGFDGDLTVVENTEHRLKAAIAGIFPDFLPGLVKERKLVVPVLNGNILKPAQSKPHRPWVVCDTINGLYFVGDTVKGDGCSGDISFSSALKVFDIIISGSSGPL